MKQFLMIALLLVCGSVRAQDSTSVTAVRDTTIAPADTTAPASTDADALLAGLNESVEAEPLLPRKMIFTQRAFWGPKGLLRVINVAPLTAEGRAKELKIRRTMLVTHQIGGFVTLAGFVAQGLLGARLYNFSGDADDYIRTKNAHRNMATFINISYGTTLALSLTSPPPAVAARKGLSSIRLHKYLAVVHLTGMVATNILSQAIQRDYNRYRPYHRAAAYATFGAYAASIITLAF